MTATDPFTAAARAEAETRVRAVNGTVLPLKDDFRDGYLYGFERGAEWARTHLAAQEPTDVEVRKAKAEAWQEGVNFALPGKETYWISKHNPHRATGTGDQR